MTLLQTLLKGLRSRLVGSVSHQIRAYSESLVRWHGEEEEGWSFLRTTGPGWVCGGERGLASWEHSWEMRKEVAGCLLDLSTLSLHSGRTEG